MKYNISEYKFYKGNGKKELQNLSEQERMEFIDTITDGKLSYILKVREEFLNLNLTNHIEKINEWIEKKNSESKYGNFLYLNCYYVTFILFNNERYLENGTSVFNYSTSMCSFIDSISKDCANYLYQKEEEYYIHNDKDYILTKRFEQILNGEESMGLEIERTFNGIYKYSESGKRIAFTKEEKELFLKYYDEFCNKVRAKINSIVD